MQHSQAKNATISLKREGNELVIRIRDDGKGFDVSRLTGIEEGGRGAGLFSIKERIRLLGGSCSIQSQPGQGTAVTGRVAMAWSTSDAKNKSIGSG